MSRSRRLAKSPKCNRHVTDMQARAADINDDLFYAVPSTAVQKMQFGTMILRPMEWFLRDLAALAKKTHPDLMLCWLRDALTSSTGATEIQLFTSAGDWRGTWTIARAHLIAPHSYRYLTLGFVENPTPCWIVIGGRHVQVWDRDYRSLVDDDSYARDERTIW